MKLHLPSLLQLPAFLLVVFFLACAKPEPLKGRLVGVVTNEFDQPLEEAQVQIVFAGGKRFAETDAYGTFSFINLPIGALQLKADKEGFLASTQQIEILAEEEIQVNIALSAGSSYLSIDEYTMNAPPRVFSFPLDIDSNTEWEVEANESWVAASSQQGQGKQSLNIRLEEHTGLKTRVATLKIKSGSLAEELVIHQFPPFQLLAVETVFGNLELGKQDSVFLHFNTDLQVSRITSKSGQCVSNLGYTVIRPNSSEEEGVSVHFEYSCGKIGGTFPFTIAVSNQFGEKLFRFDAEFFDKRVEVPGRILDYAISEVDQTYWVLSHDTSPNQLFQFSLKDLSLLQQFDLPVESTGFALNFVRNEIYLFESPDDFSYEGSETITVIDKFTGTYKREFDIPTDPDDHPTHPDNVPFDLGFNAYGAGVVLLTAPTTTIGGWKIIDSQKQDSMWNHPLASFPNAEFRKFENVHLNFDRTKFYLTGQNGVSAVAILHSDLENLDMYLPPKNTRGIFITPNRTNNRFYSGQIYNQLIVNPDNGYESLESFLDNRRNGNADFCYLPGKEDVIYFVQDGDLQVLDYATQTTYFFNTAVWDLRGATTSTDGSSLVMYKQGKNFKEGTTEFCSEVFLVDPSRFWQ
jgi:hypothetical protein